MKHKRDNALITWLASIACHPQGTTHNENTIDSWAPTSLTIEPRVVGNGQESVTKPTGVVNDDDRDVSHGDDDEENKAFFEFTRDPARKSLNNNVAMLRWLDAQERVQDRFQDDEVNTAYH